jgi:hypothetical protein
MALRRRGGSHEAELHADAQRLLSEADYPASVKQVILMTLRGGRPRKQLCLVCGKAAQQCQLFVPPGLTQAVPDLTAKPSVYWLCDTHHGQVSNEDIVVLLAQQGRGRQGARRQGGPPHG